MHPLLGLLTNSSKQTDEDKRHITTKATIANQVESVYVKYPLFFTRDNKIYVTYKTKWYLPVSWNVIEVLRYRHSKTKESYEKCVRDAGQFSWSLVRRNGEMKSNFDLHA